MDQLMQANLQIIELLGAVFEEVERRGTKAAPGVTRGRSGRSREGRPRRPTHVGVQTTTH